MKPASHSPVPPRPAPPQPRGRCTIARFVTPLASLALPLAACKPVGPDYQGAPKVGHSGRFFGSSRAQQRAPQLDRWWRQLGSTELDRLIDDALANNHDLAIAGQRLREARALRKGVASALLPQAGANLSYTRLDIGGLVDDEIVGPIASGSLFDNPIEYWGGGFDVAWEIDVFGGRRRELRGARAREDATREALQGVRLAIAAEVAESYSALATLREQRAQVREQVKLQESQTKDMRERLAAGATSKLDLDRAIARLETTRAELPRLEAGITGQLRRLALLAGKPPGALDRRAIANVSLPEKLPMSKTGLPADLVLRRPDLRRSERELAAATEDIGVAVAEFYPKFNLAGGPSGFGGSFGDLFDASNFYWQYGPRVDWSPFTGGANRAALESANARGRAAMLGYERDVLAAIGEVETELANLQAETRRLEVIQRARAATAAAVKRVRENHEAGATNFVEVLIEEERLRVIEISEIRAKGQMLQVWIRLHKALGGGPGERADRRRPRR